MRKAVLLQKVSNTPISTNKPAIGVYVYNYSYEGGVGKRTEVQSWQNMRPHLKNNQNKKGLGVWLNPVMVP
jgi:hypothetical protein